MLSGRPDEERGLGVIRKVDFEQNFGKEQLLERSGVINQIFHFLYLMMLWCPKGLLMLERLSFSGLASS